MKYNKNTVSDKNDRIGTGKILAPWGQNSQSLIQFLYHVAPSYHKWSNKCPGRLFKFKSPSGGF